LKVRLFLSPRRYEDSLAGEDINVDHEGGGEGKVSTMIVDQRRENLLQSSLAGDPDERIPAKLVTDLEGQISTLFDAVNEANPHFWKGLLVNAKEHLNARPRLISPGGRTDMQLKVQYSYHAWKEDPEAREYIQAVFAQPRRAE
jgi:hypothetical protein